MISIRDFSIKNKLVLMQVFTAMLVLGLCFAAFVITDIQGYKDRKVTATISFAKVIGTNSISAIQFLDNQAAEQTLSDLQTVESDVVNSAIIDIRGQLFASHAKKGHENYRFSPPFSDKAEFIGDHLYVYQDITDLSGTKLGTVCLKVELTQLAQIKNQKFEIAGILLIIGIAFAFLLAYINQRYISVPLLNLVKVIRQIRENNDYGKHVDVDGKDEISALSSEFNNLMDEVEKTNRKKDEFIGIASHELKTPLTSVKLYLETLSRMEHEPLVRTFISKSRDGVNKLHSLILDLLDVSKIDSGQLQLNHKEVDIDSLLDACIADGLINVPNHQIYRTGGKVNTTILGDWDRLEQVLINFISNAAKYSPAGTDISIGTELTNEGKVMVSVTDQGIGIPGSEHQMIFDRFYRAKDSNAVISGFGLGLYICAQIIKRHKGTIGVKSKEGKGSTFYFILPVVKPGKTAEAGIPDADTRIKQ